MSVPTFHMFDTAPAAVAPYSHAVEIDGWVFLTGQLPMDADDENAPIPDSIEAQTKKVMDNLGLVLEELDLSLANAVSARVFLTHFEQDYEQMNRTYAEYFPADRRPARTCVGVTALAAGARVEIDLIARRRMEEGQANP